MADLPLPTLEEVESELAHRSLRELVMLCWRHVEPSSYVHGKVVEAICDHLEAVFAGDIRKLIVTVPPRHTKSLLTSCFFPAWCWLRDARLRFLFASYAHNLSIRDSVRCRRVMASAPYQRALLEASKSRGLEPWVFTDDQNTKIRYDNSMGGYRIATSVDGSLTGEGGDIIVVDDPHNVIDGESEAVRRSTLQWWDEAMSTRLNDAKTGRYVIIGQRVHEEDLIGHILGREDDWVHLCLPARHEGETRTVTVLPQWQEDWRTKEGEPLWPERFGEKELDEMEKRLGPYATAAQLQQRPSPRIGGMFQPEEAKRLGALVHVLPSVPAVVSSVRSWDKAGTAGGGCRTAGVRIDRLADGRCAVSDVVTGQWVASDRERIIRATAERDGHAVHVLIEQEGGSGGKESAENTIRNLAGYNVTAEHPTGDKATRAEPYSIQFNLGNVLVPSAHWTKDFLEEHRQFPMGKFKDQVDAAAAGFNFLMRARKKAGAWG